jgi:transcription initiation factor IIE alpha subunit
LDVKQMEQQMVYLVDLLQAPGTGDFACPKCGSVLSPDDETEESYCILEPIVKGNELDALVIRC